MKRLALVCLLATAVVGLHAKTYVDNARVRSADPQYESVSVPREECSSHWVNETRRTGGREYGGAVVGAFAGDRIANRDRWEQYEEVPREVTTCRTVSDVQTRIAGYWVNYEYRGQQFTTLMRENPGPSLPVRVSVDPVER